MKTLALAVILCLSQAACIKHAVLTPAQNIRLTSAESIGVLSALNDRTNSLTIRLNKSHAIPDDLTGQILGYTEAVAKAVRPLVDIQRSTSTDQQKADAAIAILRQIKLPSGISGFVNSPGASGEVASLVTILKATIGGIQTLVGGK